MGAGCDPYARRGVSQVSIQIDRRGDGLLDTVGNLQGMFDIVYGLQQYGEFISPETRHLDLYLAQMTLLDKSCQAYALGGVRTRDCIEMNCIAMGVTREELARDPAVVAVVNTNSPMQLDIPMTEAVVELAASGQACCITPFTLAGSMSPATLAGTLAQQTAEVLAVMTLAQSVRPGAKLIYGSFASNVDMLSGAPALGTPEYTKAAFASGQIARRLGMPLRSSNTTSSNCVDAQAAYESEMSLWGSIMGGANLICHAAGWLENGIASLSRTLPRPSRPG